MLTEAQIYITRGCNYRCGYCNLAKKDSELIDELNCKEWEKAFCIMQNELGVKTAKILGGEPTRLTWLPELIEYINKNSSIKVAILSNSSFNYALAEKLADAGLFGYFASIDTLKNLESEQIDFRKKSAKGYEMLLEFKRLGIPLLGANIVIHKQNIHEIPMIIEKLSDLGIWGNVCTLQIANQEKEFSRAGVDKNIRFYKEDKKELEDLSRELIKLKRSNAKITAPESYLENLAKYGINSNWQCNEISQLRIDSNGDFMFCPEWKWERTGLSTRYNILSINKKTYTKFLAEWKKSRPKINCEGCFWSSIWTAENRIKNGGEEFDYAENAV